MKTSRIIIVIGLLAFVAVLYYSMRGGESLEDYARELQKEREEKDVMMKSGDDSPFAKSTDPFTGLNYFPPDLKYRITADLVPIESKKTLSLPTSDGKVKHYQEYAYAEFNLDGVFNRLLILEIIDSGPYRGTLFLAFADETSAAETYGAGRYLEVKKTPGASTITLDFNRAYNPYCAYSDAFSCPFPPRENILKVAIKAGEKNYKELD